MNWRTKLFFIIWLGFAAACAPPALAPIDTAAPPPSDTGTPPITRAPTLTATSTRTPTPYVIRTWTPSPTLATRTRIPTATTTPTPTRYPSPPLTKHEFMPNPILLRYQTGGGDGGYWADWPSELIVYGNGEIFLDGYVGSLEYQPLRRNLPRKEMCRLFYTIEQTGFFNLSGYINPHFSDGTPISTFEVDIWDNTLTLHDELSSILYYSDPIYDDLYIPSELIDTFLLLDNYNPGGMKYYQIDKMVLWVQTSYDSSPASPWPLSSPSLQFLADNYFFRPYIIESKDIFISVSSITSGDYEEAGQVYYVVTRPLWPYEVIQNNQVVDLGPPASELTDPISCFVRDGLLPIPTAPR